MMSAQETLVSGNSRHAHKLNRTACRCAYSPRQLRWVRHPQGTRSTPSQSQLPPTGHRPIAQQLLPIVQRPQCLGQRQVCTDKHRRYTSNPHPRACVVPAQRTRPHAPSIHRPGTPLPPCTHGSSVSCGPQPPRADEGPLLMQCTQSSLDSILKTQLQQLRSQAA